MARNGPHHQGLRNAHAACLFFYIFYPSGSLLRRKVWVEAVARNCAFNVYTVYANLFLFFKIKIMCLLNAGVSFLSMDPSEAGYSILLYLYFFMKNNFFIFKKTY